MRWLNLKKDEPNNIHWLCGRAWIKKWRVEWCVWRAPICLSFEIDNSENEYTFSLGTGIFCIFVSREFKRHMPIQDYETYEFDIRWVIDTINFKLWGPKDEWNSRDPWWRRGVSLNVVDFLLGTPKYSEITNEVKKAFVPMPEGCYPCDITLFTSTWKRPRWFTKRIKRATINVENGIPHEGKGENSWDCGEDGLFRLTCPATTIEEAIGAVVSSVLKDRRNYGSGHTHRNLGMKLAQQ